MADPSSSLPESLASERLQLHVARPGDGAALNAAIVESYPELALWMPWVYPQPSVEESEQACRRAYARRLLNEELMALLFRKSDGVLTGATGLHRVDWPLRRFEIGYWGHTGYLSQGYLSEAVRTLAEHALSTLRANRVFLQTDARNLASCRLAEHVGFTLEGTLRNDRLGIDGQLRDTRVYARIAG